MTPPLLDAVVTALSVLMVTGIAAVLAGVTFTNRRRGASFLEAVPAGYGPGVLGVLIFGPGGVGDFFWHSTVGFEQGVEALTSPSHLSLAVGAVLFLSSPLRATWRRSGTPSAAEVLPVLLVGTGLALSRRFELPFGALTFVFLGPGLIALAVNPEYAPLLLAFVVAGLVGDLLVRVAPPAPGRALSLRLFGAAVPLSFALTFFVVAEAVLPRPVAWTVDVWTGSVFLAGLGGVIVTYMTVPDATLEPNG